MSNTSFDRPQVLEQASAVSSPRPDAVTRPGWPEITVGLVVLATVTIGGAVLAGRLGLDSVVYGLVFTALSGIVGIAGFAAAVLLRIRSLYAFGMHRTTGRWLLVGVGAGIVAFALKSLAIAAWIQLTGGDAAPVQAVYGDAGSGGVLSLILATVLITLLTPLGEALFFRGVVANALLCYGPVVGVVGSALIFALSHGINNVFPTALVVGLIAGEAFRRSGSVWPGVVIHAVVNLPTVPVLVLASMA